jgi:hypothetical protein
MGRVVIPILSLAAAIAAAVLFGIVAQDDFGIAADTIRTAALASAGFIFVVLAGGSLLRRNR